MSYSTAENDTGQLPLIGNYALMVYALSIMLVRNCALTLLRNDAFTQLRSDACKLRVLTIHILQAIPGNIQIYIVPTEIQMVRQYKSKE